MKSGDVFKVDAQAVDELAAFFSKDRGSFAKLEGVEFSIAKSKVTPAITANLVRASKWKDGKPSKGRPRKFPRTTVARLLGIEDDPGLSEETASEQADELEVQEAESLDATAEELIAASTPKPLPDALMADASDDW